VPETWETQIALKVGSSFRPYQCKPQSMSALIVSVARRSRATQSLQGNKAKTWQQLLNNNSLPYMAMLRNLRNLLMVELPTSYNAKVAAKVSAFTPLASGRDCHSDGHHSKVGPAWIGAQISSEREVAHSRQFPSRFLAAFYALQDAVNTARNTARETAAAASKAKGRGGKCGGANAGSAVRRPKLVRRTAQVPN